MARAKRVELYRWLLTADPPICARGNPVAVLNACERRRQDEECWCRFDVSEAADDLEAAGAAHLVEWLNDDLEPDDVASLADDLARVVARPTAETEPDGNERGRNLERRFRRLVEAGAASRTRTPTISTDVMSPPMHVPVEPCNHL
jgi:hypothetical protein